MDNVPTSFDPVPINFFISLLIPTIVLLGVMICFICLVVPISYYTFELTKQEKVKWTVVFGLMSGVLWFLSINGIVGSYLDDTLVISSEIFDTVDIVSTNLDIIDNCIDKRTNEFDIDLKFVADVETEFEKHKDTVVKWHGTAETTVIIFYVLLGVGSLIIPFLIYKGFKTSTLILAVVMGVVIMILFIVLVPVSNVGYSGLFLVCGNNIEGHNKKINELIQHIDKQSSDDTFCDDKTWQYLCDIQTCNFNEPVLNEVFNVTELQHANNTGNFLSGCDYEHVERIIISTLEDTLGCDKIRGYYERFVNGIVCTEFHELFAYTLWPVGFASVFTIILIFIAFFPETDYTIIK